MSRKYYWKIGGYLYEVPKEKYMEYKKEQDRHDYLRKNEQEATILSFDSLGENGRDGESFLADTKVNVEEEVIHNIMLQKLSKALEKLTAEELLLIDRLYTQMKTEREIAEIMGISQKAVNKRKIKLLDKLKKFLEK